MKSVKAPAVMDSLPMLVAFVSEFSELNSLSPSLKMQFELAAEEAAVNVINYAYKDSVPGDVEIACGVEDGSAVLVIKDSGVHFDVSQRPDPDIDKPVEERKIGGLGIFLIKKMMDETKYERAGESNILTLKKKISAG